MKIAITGSTGLIGTHLMQALLQKKNVTVSSFDKKIHSLASASSLKDFVRDADIIIHLAGVTHTKNIDDYFAVNSLGTLHLLEALHLYGKSNAQFILCSSFAVYEEQETQTLLSETDTKTNPRSHYGLSKLFAEELVSYAQRKYGIPTRILRVANPYGPVHTNTYNGIISILIDKIQKGEEITIQSDGTQSRDFIFVDDIAQAFIDVLDYQGDSLLINICSGHATRIVDLIHIVEKLLNKKALLKFETNIYETGYWIGNPQKAIEEINFKAHTELEEGLQQTIDWYIKHT